MTHRTGAAALPAWWWLTDRVCSGEAAFTIGLFQSACPLEAI